MTDTISQVTAAGEEEQMPELITDGRVIRIVDRKMPAAYSPKRPDLGPNAIRWCRDNLKGFTWPKAERVKEKV